MTALHPAVEIVRRDALPFQPGSDDLGRLLDAIGDPPFVRIGEASHGTHECHRTRAALTRELVERHGFNVVAFEADWPDAYRGNRWVRHAAEETMRHMRGRVELEIVPGATHLFEEPGALEQVARLASDWGRQHPVPGP